MVDNKKKRAPVEEETPPDFDIELLEEKIENLTSIKKDIASQVKKSSDSPLTNPQNMVS